MKYFYVRVNGYLKLKYKCCEEIFEIFLGKEIWFIFENLFECYWGWIL